MACIFFLFSYALMLNFNAKNFKYVSITGENQAYINMLY